MIRLTRCYRISASHRLHTPSLPESENQRVYGKCNNPFGHGHNYIVEVSVKGPVEKATGRVVNLARLDEFVREMIIDRFDHRDLNRDVAEFAGVPPTSENLATVIQNRLRSAWSTAFEGSTATLDRVRIRETRNNIIEVNGNQ
ncbi:MAG: 6-carboxytetrahydropterin synthase [Bryobacteraceae bacterium]